MIPGQETKVSYAAQPEKKRQPFNSFKASFREFSLFSLQSICKYTTVLLILPMNYEVKLKVAQSCPTLCDFMDTTSPTTPPPTHATLSPWKSKGQNTGVGSLSLLQGIFPTQGSDPGLLHCRQILYQLSHELGAESKQ